MAALANQSAQLTTNTNNPSVLSSQQHSSRGTGAGAGGTSLQSSLPPSGKHPQQYQNNNAQTSAASINNLNLMKLNDDEPTNSNFKSPGHQIAATGDDTVPSLIKAQQFPTTNNSSSGANSANSKSVKRVLNEQITQPLSSSSRH